MEPTVGHYKSNLRDIEFNLFEVLRRQDLLGSEPYADLDEETVRGILDEVNRLAAGPLADSFADGDRNPPVFDPQTSSVRMPESFKKSFAAWMDAQWYRLGLPSGLGGTGAPRSLIWSLDELVLGANPAVWMYSSGPSFATVLWHIGTPEQRRFAELAVERQWGATMVLTEPDAGSDVGAGRAKAVEQPDGTWHIEGVKRFITSGEHDMAENIFHLGLARPEGHGPGTKGLSMFLVPKYLVGEDGTPGERNGVYVTGVEHKMGLKASTTCELSFGAKHPAVGTLVGGVHEGDRHPVHRLPERARLRQDPGTGRRPQPDDRQDRAAGDDHSPPRCPPHAHAAEGLRGGHAGAGAVHGDLPGCRPGRGGQRPPGRDVRPDQRPAAPHSQGGGLGTLVRAAHAVPADARRLRVSAGLPHRAVHQGRQDRQPVRGHHRDPGHGPVLPEDREGQRRRAAAAARRDQRVRGVCLGQRSAQAG